MNPEPEGLEDSIWANVTLDTTSFEGIFEDIKQAGRDLKRAKRFPNVEWFQQTPEERGAWYVDFALTASLDPYSLLPYQWSILGAALVDDEAIAFIANESVESNLGLDVREMLSEENLSNLIEYVSNENSEKWRDSQIAFENGRRAIVSSDDPVGDVARLGIDLGFLFVGGGGLVKAAKLSAYGVGFLAKSWIGKGIARAFVRAAPLLDDVPTAFLRFRQFGFFGGGGYWAGATIADVYYAKTDPEGFIARGEKNVAIANGERAGFTFSMAGQAAGEDVLVLDESVVIRDPDGNIITQEQFDKMMGDEPTVVTATTTTTTLPRPAQIAGTRDVPQYQQQQLSQAPTGIVALDEGVSFDGIGVDGQGMTRSEFLFEQRKERQTEEFNRDPSLAVPSDYYRGPDDKSLLVNDQALLRAMGPRAFMEMKGIDTIREPTSAIYRESSVLDQVANWGVFDIIAFQGKAIEAGLVNPDTLFSGTADPQTINALTSAMSQANINGYGMTFDEAMDEMVEARARAKELYGDEDQPPTWSPSRAYEAPDYATISQDVKSLFARGLGRDPNAWEMDLLADQFRSDNRADYNQDMTMEEAVFDARGRAQETGEVQIPPASQDVDPHARMAETFDDQFSDELDARSRWADVQAKSSNLFGSFDKLSRA